METTLSLLRTTRPRLLDETDDEDYTGGNYDYLITVGVILFFLVCCCARFYNSPQSEAVNSRGQLAPESTEGNATATSNDNVGVSSGFDDDHKFTQRRNRIDKMLLYKVRLDNVLPTKSRCNAFRGFLPISCVFPPFNIRK
jgi:hypothetical protein